jgi:hypothetical protein
MICNQSLDPSVDRFFVSRLKMPAEHQRALSLRRSLGYYLGE